jgi:hypothetical protein
MTRTDALRTGCSKGECMAAIGLAEAARLTGRNQSTIHRAMKAGKLSFTKDEAGERKVDVAELERVFGLRSPANGLDDASVRTGGDSNASHDTHGIDLAAAQGRVDALQGRLDERERMIAQLTDAIRDLRQRLDSEVVERRQLIALLTDRRPWWRRWFR